ncbi:hypothetical protein BDZ89DRAFT_1028474 [Hymenopellis radicata]|nr:hypothetical protein BDZ89DRAFT_1028474 [Hymenopellis radicata]
MLSYTLPPPPQQEQRRFEMYSGPGPVLPPLVNQREGSPQTTTRYSPRRESPPRGGTPPTPPRRGRSNSPSSTSES